MKNLDKALAWLKRAKSNLTRAKVGKVSEDIRYEDLCFDVQQEAVSIHFCRTLLCS